MRFLWDWALLPQECGMWGVRVICCCGSDGVGVHRKGDWLAQHDSIKIGFTEGRHTRKKKHTQTMFMDFCAQMPTCTTWDSLEMKSNTTGKERNNYTAAKAVDLCFSETSHKTLTAPSPKTPITIPFCPTICSKWGGGRLLGVCCFSNTATFQAPTVL